MSQQMNANFVAVALGATLALVATAASMIYQKYRESKEEQEHMMMQDKIARLNLTIAELRSEVTTLKELQAKSKKKALMRRKLRKRKDPFDNSSLTNDMSEYETDADTFSTVDTDVGDDEFYDCSDVDDESDTENGDIGKLKKLQAVLDNIDDINDDSNQKDELYDFLKKLVEENPNNVELVWRLARTCYICSENESNDEKKKKFLAEGLQVCERVLEIPNTSLYKWYAILVGSQCNFQATKEKITNGYRYKEYVEKALELSKDDSSLHHLLGRFKYEVASLSWFERKVATTIFAEPPNATYEEALKHFEDADKLSEKPEMENKLFMGKCYVSLKKYEKACESFRSIAEIIPNSEKEQEMQIEAESLLSKYSRY